MNHTPHSAPFRSMCAGIRLSIQALTTRFAMLSAASLFLSDFCRALREQRVHSHFIASQARHRGAATSVSFRLKHSKQAAAGFPLADCNPIADL
jgi:hypothetical protein